MARLWFLLAALCFILAGISFGNRRPVITAHQDYVIPVLPAPPIETEEEKQRRLSGAEAKRKAEEAEKRRILEAKKEVKLIQYGKDGHDIVSFRVVLPRMDDWFDTGIPIVYHEDVRIRHVDHDDERYPNKWAFYGAKILDEVYFVNEAIGELKISFGYSDCNSAVFLDSHDTLKVKIKADAPMDLITLQVDLRNSCNFQLDPSASAWQWEKIKAFPIVGF